MVMLRRRWTRFGFILSLLAMLALAVSFEPRTAIARPAPSNPYDGPPPGTGDPTGDDVPSPTPKPTIRLINGGTTTPAFSTWRGRWSALFSILVRLRIR